MRESQLQITEKACTYSLQTAMLLSTGVSGPVGSSNAHVCVQHRCLTVANPLWSCTAWERMLLDHCGLIKQDALDWKEGKTAKGRAEARMGQGADRRSMSSPGPATGIRALVGGGGTGQPETKQDGNP